MSSWKVIHHSLSFFFSFFFEVILTSKWSLTQWCMCCVPSIGISVLTQISSFPVFNLSEQIRYLSVSCARWASACPPAWCSRFRIAYATHVRSPTTRCRWFVPRPQTCNKPRVSYKRSCARAAHRVCSSSGACMRAAPRSSTPSPEAWVGVSTNKNVWETYCM